MPYSCIYIFPSDIDSFSILDVESIRLKTKLPERIDYLTKSCNEFECKNSNLKEGICYPQKKKYIDRILFINWFNRMPKSNNTI